MKNHLWRSHRNSKHYHQLPQDQNSRLIWWKHWNQQPDWDKKRMLHWITNKIDKRDSKRCISRTKELKCQTKLRKLQNIWWQKEVVELLGYADVSYLRNFYAGMKQLFGLVWTSIRSLPSADNVNTPTNPQDILLYWRNICYSLK